LTFEFSLNTSNYNIVSDVHSVYMAYIVLHHIKRQCVNAINRWSCFWLCFRDEKIACCKRSCIWQWQKKSLS